MNLTGISMTRHALDRFQQLHKLPAPKKGAVRYDRALMNKLASARRVKLLKSTRAVMNFFKYGEGVDYYFNAGFWFVVAVNQPRQVLTVYRAQQFKRGRHWDFDGTSDGR